jgi:putative IMPACT (imprinted ancient) family translation regulator
MTTIEQENLVDDNKHNSQAKLPVLNWHNQNPNINTVEILTVFL